MKSVTLQTTRHPNSLLFVSSLASDDSPEIDDRPVAIWASGSCLAIGTTADEGAAVSVEFRMSEPEDASGLVRESHVLASDGVLRLQTSAGEELMRVEVPGRSLVVTALLDDQSEPTRIVLVVGDSALGTQS